MIRTVLRPGWLALLALLVLVVISFSQLGLWQLGVSANEAARERAAAQAARPTEPLGQVTGPHQAFPDDGAGLSVTLTGEYLPGDQFLVPDRLLEGRPGYWVVTPVRTGAAGEPALLPVVRGFVTDPAQAVPPGPGTVALEGTLAPVESPVGSTGLPAGQRGSIDAADLANAWDEPLFNAFIFLVSEEPALTDPAIERIPPPVFGDTGIVWRNVGYGLQWFVFAGFACYMYYRFVRDAHQARNAADQAEPTPTTTTLRGDPA